MISARNITSTENTAESELAATLLRIRSGALDAVSNELTLQSIPADIPAAVLEASTTTSHPIFLPSRDQGDTDGNVILTNRISSVVNASTCESASLACSTRSSLTRIGQQISPSTESSTSQKCSPSNAELNEYAANASVDSFDEDELLPGVRREIIEAALLSQPQRGRKRDNLSMVERLELTRTRNREHAKSTRIRKKMRHQELLDKESKLQIVMKKEELSNKRCQCVLDYISLRQSSLQLRYQSESLTSEETQRSNESWNRKYQKMVDVLFSGNLRFESNGVVYKNDEESDAFALMHKFGGILADFVRAKFGSSLELQLLSGNGSSLLDGDVALSSSGIALIQLCLGVFIERRFTKVANFWIRFEFESNTSRIKFVAENMSKDSIPSDFRDENLETQVSHPSVVSLDSSQGGHQSFKYDKCNGNQQTTLEDRRDIDSDRGDFGITI